MFTKTRTPRQMLQMNDQNCETTTKIIYKERNNIFHGHNSQHTYQNIEVRQLRYEKIGELNPTKKVSENRKFLCKPILSMRSSNFIFLRPN